jgi:tetratricopeptide (TPR) repeat protein
VTLVAGGLGMLVFFSFDSRFNRGKTLEEKGLFDNALQVFSEEASRNPGNFEAHWHMGNIYYRKKLYDKAMEEYEDTLAILGNKMHSDEIVLHKVLQKLYHRKFMFNESFVKLKIILLYEPENVEALYLMGQFLAAGRNYQEGIKIFNNILGLAGEFQETRLFLALSQLEYGAKDEAISNLEKVLELSKDNAFVHLILGYLYKDTNHERSVRNFELSSEIGFDFFYEYNSKIMLSFFYMDRNEYEKSIDILESIVSSTKEMDIQSASDVLFNIAWCYYKLEKRIKSVEYWEQLIKANFRYIDSYAVFKTYDPREIETLEDKWRDAFSKRNYPSVQAKLGSFQKLNLTLAEKMFESWYKERQAQIEENPIKSLDEKIKHIDDFPELGLGEIQALGRKVISRLGYMLKEEIPSTAGYDALIERRDEKYKRLFHLRAWGRVVGEIAVTNLRSNIDAVGSTGGVLVTAADYSDGAVEAAARFDIMLVDKAGLAKALEVPADIKSREAEE